MPNELGFDDKCLPIAWAAARRFGTTPVSLSVPCPVGGVVAMNSFAELNGFCGIGLVDRKPVFWKYGEMKTTLDLPDDLMREVKIRAVHEHKKLKDAIAELIRKGMAAGETRAPRLPKPVKLRGGFKPTTEEIEAAIAWGRD